jgi:SH3-like domain-containing protein
LNLLPRRRYQRIMPRNRILALSLAVLAWTAPASAQEIEVPYWASIRASEVNMRVGPAEDYRIAWVYRRQQLPLKVLRVKDGWRLVQDPDGAKGWILSRFLTRQRTGYVIGKEPAEMRAAADSAAKVNWRLSPGIVGLLGDCEEGWCEFALGQRKGFVRQDRLWGAGEP